MACWCGRQDRGIGYDNRAFFTHEKKLWWFCSMDHMRMFKKHYEKEKTELDITGNEEKAIINAHQYAGEWLKEKGETDLRKLSVAEQYEFMKIIYGNVCDQLAKIEAENPPHEAPF